jgi:uncharacterized damage-inducible protein DinB
MIELTHALRVLGGMPSFVEGCARSVGPEWLQRPTPKTFSLIENVCHLRDVDREGYAIRVARIAEEVLPDLTDVDGAALAAARNYQVQDLKRALRQFARERSHALATLRSLSEQDLVRRATWGTFGVVTLAEVLQHWIAHDDEHRMELNALVEFISGAAPPEVPPHD